MVVSGSLNRWVWYHTIPQLAGKIPLTVYTTCSPGQVGDYMVPIPPIKGTTFHSIDLSAGISLSNPSSPVPRSFCRKTRSLNFLPEFITVGTPSWRDAVVGFLPFFGNANDVRSKTNLQRWKNLNDE